MTFAGVFRISPDRGTLTLLVDNFLTPNGLAFSPDERVLYVNDSQRRHIRAFDLQPNGTLARQTDRVFADLSGPDPGVPDGMKVDSAGNVFCGGAGGLYILDPTGKKLGRIVHGFGNTANVARRVWRRRLEDHVLLHPHQPRFFQGEGCRRAGTYGTQIMIYRGCVEALRAFSRPISNATPTAAAE